jgi:hypothetical protein
LSAVSIRDLTAVKEDIMALQSLEPQNQDGSPTESSIWHMRWFQMISPLAIVLIVAIGSLIAFYFTRSPYCFTPCLSLIAPAWKLFSRITNFLFPQDEKDFQLELFALKIQRKKRVP